MTRHALQGQGVPVGGVSRPYMTLPTLSALTSVDGGGWAGPGDVCAAAKRPQDALNSGIHGRSGQVRRERSQLILSGTMAAVTPLADPPVFCPGRGRL